MIREDGAVEVSIEIAARPSTVFRYFVDPERFSSWVQAAVRIDPRPDGELEVAFAQGGNRVVGHVLEVVDDRRIAFSWGMAEGCPDAAKIPPGSTRITLSLDEIPTGTRVTLVHEGLAEELRREHVGGWVYYFSQLSPKASAEHFATLLPDTARGFLEAWNDTDAGSRLSLLEKVFADSGVYRGKYGVAESRDALDAHIAACQKFIPGLVVRSVSTPCLSHGHFTHDWEIVRGESQGGIVERGRDFARLDIDGRITELVSFATE